MKQVLFFYGKGSDDLQEKINNWIAANHTDNEILDIKYQPFYDGYYRTSYFSAMIIYEKKNSN